MSEEVFDRKKADELTLRIADRLGKRQEKIDCMAEWERGSRRMELRPITLSALAIAACLVVVFIIQIPRTSNSSNPLDELGIAAPSFELYRSAVPELSEITHLISDQKYIEALPKVHEALEHSDLNLRELEMALQNNDDEVLSDEKETEQVLNGELRWAYIWLLVFDNNNEKALEQIDLYLNLQLSLISHEVEAKELKKKLENM